MKPTYQEKQEAYKVISTLKIIFNGEYVKNNVSSTLNELRHSGTNYDQLCNQLNKMDLSLAVCNAAVHALQNKVNNKIDRVKNKAIKQLVAQATGAAVEVVEVTKFIDHRYDSNILEDGTYRW